MRLDADTYRVLVPEPLWIHLEVHIAVHVVVRRRTEPHRREQKRLWAREHRVTKRTAGEPCPQCGKAVHRPRGWVRTFCSDICRARFHDAARRAQAKAARVAALRPVACAQCGALVHPKAGRKVPKFCSKKCRNNHFNRRRRSAA